MRISRYDVAIVVAIVFLLGGCTPLTQAALTGDLTDAAINRLEAVNDKALSGLEAAQDALDAKQARLDKLKGRFPYTALVRYAQGSPARAEAVLRDCGLSVSVDAVAVGLPEDG